MANPPVPLPNALVGSLNSIINLDPLDDPVGIPTNEQIVRENRHLLRVQHFQQFQNGNLNNDDYGNAIVRHHRNLSVRANAEILVQLSAFQVQLTEGLAAFQVQLTEGLNGLNRRFDIMEITRLVDRARAFNNLIPAGHMNAEFMNVVKHTPGHPNYIPPDIDNVNFEALYNVGDYPPDGLVPRTYARFNELVTSPLPDLRRILRGIYWFYNDPTLQLTANTRRVNCLIVLERLKAFIVHS